MWRDATGVTLHADSLKEVAGHRMHGRDERGEWTEGDDFVVYGVEEGEGMFRVSRFYGFAEAVDIVLVRGVGRQCVGW